MGRIIKEMVQPEPKGVIGWIYEKTGINLGNEKILYHEELPKPAPPSGDDPFEKYLDLPMAKVGDFTFNVHDYLLLIHQRRKELEGHSRVDDLPNEILIKIDAVVRADIEDSIWRYLVENEYLVERGKKNKA